jgi:hypothetical protein
MQRVKLRKSAATTRKPRKKTVARAKVLPPMPLVLVDSTRLRQEIKREYEEVVRELAKAREELEHFHQKDVPGFSRWVSSQFGALLTEIRETSNKLQESQTLLFEVEREVMYSGVSHIQAYARVMEEKKRQQSGGEPEEKETKGQDEFDFDFGGSGHEFHDEDFAGFETAKQSRHDSLPENARDRLKALYRAVVRLLHPDARKEMSGEKIEWWHQAQAAYEAGDAGQLEVILSLCEIDEAGSSDKTSLSVLKRIIGQFRSSLTQVARQIAGCRRDPAWKFSQRQEFEKLKTQIGRKLKQDLRMMKDELEWMEEQLSVWRQQVEQMRRPVYYRRRRSSGGW